MRSGDTPRPLKPGFFKAYALARVGPRLVREALRSYEGATGYPPRAVLAHPATARLLERLGIGGLRVLAKAMPRGVIWLTHRPADARVLGKPWREGKEEMERARRRDQAEARARVREEQRRATRRLRRRLKELRKEGGEGAIPPGTPPAAGRAP